MRMSINSTTVMSWKEDFVFYKLSFHTVPHEVYNREDYVFPSRVILQKRTKFLVD